MFLFSDVSCIYGYSHRGYPAKKDDATLNWVWTKSSIELFNYWKVPPIGIYLCQPLHESLWIQACREHQPTKVWPCEPNSHIRLPMADRSRDRSPRISNGSLNKTKHQPTLYSNAPLDVKELHGYPKTKRDIYCWDNEVSRTSFRRQTHVNSWLDGSADHAELAGNFIYIYIHIYIYLKYYAYIYTYIYIYYRAILILMI